MPVNAPLVLASRSPRRLELLQSIGIQDVQVVPADIDETPLKEELPRVYVGRVASEKARAVYEKLKAVAAGKPLPHILAADTAVAVGRRIFGKAATVVEARQQMQLFSGRRHRVYTGVALVTPEGHLASRIACTRLSIKRLSSEELEFFLKSEEWKGVAGYRIQGIFGAFVKEIQGQPATVIGLPLYEVSQLLQGLGYPLFKGS